MKGWGITFVVVGVLCLLLSYSNVPTQAEWAFYDLLSSGPKSHEPPGQLVIPLLVAGCLLFITGVLMLLRGKRNSSS